MTSRRSFLKAAAWSVPAIAVAVGTPTLAASDEPEIDICTDGTADAYYQVTDDHIVVKYNPAPDIYEINVRYPDGSTMSFGTNYGTAPENGSLVWMVPILTKPSWVQVHGFNAHFGESC